MTAGQLASADPGRPRVERDAVAVEAPALLPIIWADPQHTAEHLALWSLERFGPRAKAGVAKFRSRRPAPEEHELERLVVERQRRVATTEGAFVGGPFMVLIPVAFCASLLAQAQMVFELAAVAGHDPLERRRAAELLVLQAAYPSADEAAAALAALPLDTAHAGKRLPAGTRADSVRRMAALLGILGTPDVHYSRFRATVGWIGVGVLVLVGFVLPLVWVPYMAYSMNRSTRRLAARAHHYYFAPSAEGVAAAGDDRLNMGGVVAFARLVVLSVFPLVFAVVGLLTGFSFVGDRWLTAIVLLFGLSVLGTLAWLAYRRWLVR